MTNPYLQRMSGGQIILAALRLYRDHLALLVTVALFPHLALLLLELALLGTGAPAPPLVYLFLLATVVVNALALAVITTAVFRVVLGEGVGVLQVYALTARENLIAVVAAYLFTALLVSLGLMLAVVPGLIAGGLFAPVVPVIMAERKGILVALSRSLALIRGELLKAMLVFTFFILVAGLLPLLTLLMQPGMGVGPFTPVLAAIVGAVTLPLGYTANVLLYLSLRSADGSGVEQLKADLEGSRPA
jgi:hypothetical protein